MSDDNSLDDLLGRDPHEIAARQALADADRAYRDAVASGSGVDAARARLREAAENWEKRFVDSVEPKDGPQIVREAYDAQIAFAFQKTYIEHPVVGYRDPNDEMTDAEESAKFFFPGLESLTEKEIRDEPGKLSAAARDKAEELRKAKDRVFAELRDHYDIATALDREEYLEPGGDVGEPPSLGWGRPGKKAPDVWTPLPDPVHQQWDEHPVSPAERFDGSDAGPLQPTPVWSAPTLPIRKLVIGGVAVGTLVVIGSFLLYGRGGSSDGKSVETGAPAAAVQGDAFPATRAAETSIAAASTPGGPALSGNYLETISVEKDPAGHMKYVAMPAQLAVSVFIVRDKSTGAITLTFNGPPPWVNVTGTAQFGQGFDSSGGTFDATGQGVVAGRQGVGVDLSGSIMAGGELQGSLTMGTNGVLPTGQAITYHIDGKRQ